MKIGIIIRNLLAQDGGTRIALSTARELASQGHALTVYTLRYDSARTYQELIAGYYPVVALGEAADQENVTVLGFHIPAGSALGAYLDDHRLARLLARRIDPATEALNPHSSRVSYLTAHYFKKYINPRVPVVWQMNDIGLLAWVNGPGNVRNPGARPAWSKRLYYRLIDLYDTRGPLKSVDGIAVLNDETRAQVREILGREAEVIRAGVDADFFRYRERTPPVGKKIHFLSYAQFVPHRRFEDGIDAIKLLAEAGYDPVYTILGDSHTYQSYRSYRDALKARAERLGVENRVTFPGRPSQPEALQAFHAADIFLHTNYMQTWGLVVFEAMATGLPVVVSSGAGAHEVLSDRTNAMLVLPKDPAGIARAALALASDPDLYRRLSREGARFVRSDITWSRYATRLLELIRKIQASR